MCGKLWFKNLQKSDATSPELDCIAIWLKMSKGAIKDGQFQNLQYNIQVIYWVCQTFQIEIGWTEKGIKNNRMNDHYGCIYN
jgi:hypothetical protein